MERKAGVIWICDQCREEHLDHRYIVTVKLNVLVGNNEDQIIKALHFCRYTKCMQRFLKKRYNVFPRPESVSDY